MFLKWQSVFPVETYTSLNHFTVRHRIFGITEKAAIVFIWTVSMKIISQNDIIMSFLHCVAMIWWENLKLISQICLVTTCSPSKRQFIYIWGGHYKYIHYRYMLLHNSKPSEFCILKPQWQKQIHLINLTTFLLSILKRSMLWMWTEKFTTLKSSLLLKTHTMKLNDIDKKSLQIA